MKKRIITLTTDFGTKDSYVSQLKAAILQINPDVSLVDICHDIPSFDIRHGAFVLGTASRHFPKGTIHIAVVDPGVGSARRPLVFETSRAIFVGPDNGLMTLALQGERLKGVYHLQNRRYFSSQVSSTFHGRDLFAPVAAHLSRGVLPRTMGPRVKDWKLLKGFVPRMEPRKIIGHVIFIDKFGNALTNITLGLWSTALAARFKSLSVGPLVVDRVVKTYSQVAKGEPAVVFQSDDLLEVAAYQGDAATMWCLKVGMEVVISLK